MYTMGLSTFGGVPTVGLLLHTAGVIIRLGCMVAGRRHGESQNVCFCIAMLNLYECFFLSTTENGRRFGSFG